MTMAFDCHTRNPSFNRLLSMYLKTLTSLFGIVMLCSCGTTRNASETGQHTAVDVSIDLVHVQNDQVRVTVATPKVSEKNAIYQVPKIIPGTYAIEDYGRYIEDFKAYDKSGNPLKVTKKDVNTWEIKKGPRLASVSYLVNDTYDCEEGSAFSEGSETIFSPGGTNIFADNNFILNLCGFVGYFDHNTHLPYNIRITHPENLYGSTAMRDQDDSPTLDLFSVARYADAVDNPIMYATPDTAQFVVDGMEVLLSVYSPRNQNINAHALIGDLKRMVVAQKHFLGPLNDTEKYAVITYISDASKADAQGFGALEHNYSTVAVFHESMTSKDLIDVISHEFFHTLTPLHIHSHEIQDFDFSQPDMSQHLWMYEGTTEYFSHLFQVNQGLISEDQFYARMIEKEGQARMFRDRLSMTKMSKRVLEPGMKGQYGNVYLKGALLSMCIDILLRENSHGERGLLDVMGDLKEKYGPNRPFDDDTFIGEFTEMTTPEVGRFIEDHIVGDLPVDYTSYMQRMGLTREPMPVPEMLVYMVHGTPYISIDTSRKVVLAVKPDSKNNFYNALGVENFDQILEVNGAELNASDLMSVLMTGYGIQEGSHITMKVIRNGAVKLLEGDARLNYVDGEGYRFTDEDKYALKEAWLRG